MKGTHFQLQISTKDVMCQGDDYSELCRVYKKAVLTVDPKSSHNKNFLFIVSV